MISLETLRHINALVARLFRHRDNLPEVPSDKLKLAIFAMENELKSLGVDPGATRYPPPPEPTSPPSKALRAA